MISKYAELTYDEYRKLKNDKYKEWKKKQTPETLEKYKQKEKAKKIRNCEICGIDCKDIYGHRKSKAHKTNVDKIGNVI